MSILPSADDLEQQQHGDYINPLPDGTVPPPLSSSPSLAKNQATVKPAPLKGFQHFQKARKTTEELYNVSIQLRSDAQYEMIELQYIQSVS